MINNFVKSPLNYTGGKFKLLNQIIPLLPNPNEIDVFYDVFCGGANVTANYPAKEIQGVDIGSDIISLFNYLKKTNIDIIIKDIYGIINHYGLSDSNSKGYEFYNCESSSGLGSFNRTGYDRLKIDFNSSNYRFDRNIMFYSLIIFGFNNQIRYNGKGLFNISVGKRDFNKSIRKNLESFTNRIQNLNISFFNNEFDSINIDYSKNNFIYADPPYLITTATYNERDGWNLDKEERLLKFLKDSSDKGIKFALSNVIEHKNKKNDMLDEWANVNNFTIHYLNHSYDNSSYQAKDKGSKTTEVLITNY